MADPSRFGKGGAFRMERRSGVENPSTRERFLPHFHLAQKKNGGRLSPSPGSRLRPEIPGPKTLGLVVNRPPAAHVKSEPDDSDSEQ